MKLKKFIQFNENMDVDMEMDMDHDSKPTNYMFFENLKTIKRLVDELLELDETEVDEILDSGHDWAADHIAVAKVDVEQVFDFLINNTEEEHDDDVNYMGNMSNMMGDEDDDMDDNMDDNMEDFSSDEDYDDYDEE